MKKHKLGDQIIVLHKLVREKQGNQRSWKIQILPQPQKVTVVGVRMLGNGSVINDGVFVFRETKRALLVASNLKTTFYVYP